MLRRRKILNRQDQLEKERIKQERRSRRRKRREGIAKWVGTAAGYMFNTRMVGWVVAAVVAVAGVILLMRLL